MNDRFVYILLILCALVLASCNTVSAPPLAVVRAGQAATAPFVVVPHTPAPTPSPLVSATWTPSPTITPTPSHTPTETLIATQTPSRTLPPTITTTPDKITIAVESAPPELIAAIRTLTDSGRFQVAPIESAQAVLRPVEGNGSVAGAYSWTYAAAAAFPTVPDDLRWADIMAYWKGDLAALTPISDTAKKVPTLVLSPDVQAWLVFKLGTPAPTVPILTVTPDMVSKTVWSMRPASWTIVPFQRLEPSLKAFTVDARNLLVPSFNGAGYPLSQNYELAGTADSVQTVRAALEKLSGFTPTNRDPSRLTVLAMTGVTALTRATAFQMEQTGIETPADDIAPWLLDSNIVHTSNEVSFAENCPYPNPIGGTTFCSRDKYFPLLKKINLKIVELTGNHNNDWGREATTHTLNLYDKAGMLTFGGGRNLADAQDALTVTHHSNNFAFIGCNSFGPTYAWATDKLPGAAPCDLAFMEGEIKRLKAGGYIVIVTIQYTEYYNYAPPKDQVDYFGQFAAWGADLVMGSQAHVPQGFGLVGRTFIHYGIGNLFFDQMDVLITRQMFADRLVFYEGRQVSAQLFTGVMEDYSRPRPMTAQERAAFLRLQFRASGW